MPHCININHKEYIALRQQSNIGEDNLKAIIAVWQEDNNFDKYPSLQEIYSLNEQLKTSVYEREEQTNEQLNKFNDTYGERTYNTVQEIQQALRYYQATFPDLTFVYDSVYKLAEADGVVQQVPAQYVIVAQNNMYKARIRFSIRSMLTDALQGLRTTSEKRYYVNDKGEKVNRTGNLIHEAFVPGYDSKKSELQNTAFFTAYHYFEKIKDQLPVKWDKLSNQEKSDYIKSYTEYVPADDDTKKLTYDELVQYIKTKNDRKKYNGNLMHKHLEVSGTKDVATLAELEAMQKEYEGIFTKEEFEEIKDKAEIYFSHKLTKYITGYEYAFELPVIIYGLDMKFFDGTQEADAIGIAGKIDLITKLGEHIYSLYDFKTGFVDEKEVSGIILKYGKKLSVTDYNLNMLKLVFNAIQFKHSRDRYARFDDIALLAINKNDPKHSREFSLLHDKTAKNEFAEFMSLATEYFKKEHNDFYKANKDLFEVNNYVAVSDNDLSMKGKSKYEKLQITLRELYSLVDRFNAGEAVKTEDIIDRVNTISYLISGEMPIMTGDIRGMHLGDVWVLGIKDKSEPLIKIINSLYEQRALEYNKENLAVSDEYKRRLYKVVKKNWFKPGAMYKDIYHWMWVKKESDDDAVLRGGEFMNTWKEDKWNTLTKDQKAFADYHRWIIRFGFFSTMNPQGGIKYIENEIKERDDLSEEDMKLLQSQIEQLKQLPDLNKLTGQYKDFRYYEGWTPRVVRQNEEADKFIDHIKLVMKNSWKLNQEDVINIATDKTLNNYTGLIVRHFGKAGAATLQEKEYTYNPEIIFAEFMQNMLKKKYFDDVHNLSVSISYIIRQKNNTLTGGSKKELNVAQYAGLYANQLAGIKSSELNVTSKRLTKLKNWVSFCALAFKWLAPQRTGLVQMSNVFSRALAGDIAYMMRKKWNIKEENIDIRHRGNIASIEADVNVYVYNLLFNRKNLHKNFLHFINSITGNTVESYSLTTDKGKYISNMSYFGGKKITPSMGYFAYRYWDITTYSVIALQYMKSITVPTKDGKGTMSMADAYKYNDETKTYEYTGGKRKTTDGRILEGLSAEEISTMKAIGRKVLGEMRNEERAAAETTTIGMIMMQFNWFFPGMINAAWKKKQKNSSIKKWMDTDTYWVADEEHKDYNKEFKKDSEEYNQYMKDNVHIQPLLTAEEQIDEGYMRTAANFVLISRLYFTNKEKFLTEWNELSDYQKQNILVAGVKTMNFLLLSMAIGFAWGYDDDEDRDKNKFALAAKYALGFYQLDKGNKWAYNIEQARLEFFFESIAIDPEGFYRSILSAATIKQLVGFFDAMKTVLGSAVMGDRIQSGPHKDWLRGMPQIMKNAPVSGIYYDAWRTWYDYEEMFGDMEN